MTEPAEACLEEQQDLCRRLGLLNDLQLSLGKQAEVRLWLRGDTQGAVPMLRERTRICRLLSDRKALCDALLHEARAYLTAVNAVEALPLVEELCRLCEDLGDAKVGAVAHAMAGLARSLVDQHGQP
jgi:hypothetical protein